MKEIKENFMNKKSYTLIILLLVVSLFMSCLNIKNLPLFFISIAANLFLINIIKIVLKTLSLEFTKKEKKVLLITIISIYIFYFISILTRNFLYYWDYSCYYNIQLRFEEIFNVGVIQGICSFISSTYSGEYGTFLSFFPEVVFSFTSKTPNAYLVSCVITFIPYLITAFMIFIKQLAKEFKIESNKLLIPSIIVFSLFPILHSAFIYGQPDLFGLVFVFLIISLTVDYDFIKVELSRLLLILIVTFILIITRRWYIYFIFSYYLCYGIGIILRNITNKDNLINILKHAIVFAIVAVVFYVITLYPLIKRIIANDFSNSYRFYYAGGVKTELLCQLKHLGYFAFVIILIGLLYGLIKKEYCEKTMIFVIQPLIIIFMFTRIQNMGIHHSLLLVPAYVYFIIMTMILFFDKRHIKILIYSILVLNFIIGIYSNNTKIFTDVALSTPNVSNYKQIKEVSNWLKNNLNEKNRAYMINHNSTYNPDIFRNFYAPDETIKEYLPYGSAIIGVHEFPTELFNSKYIITTTPYLGISMDNIYNDIFMEQVKKNKFKLIKSFDMKDGYNLKIYERIEIVDCKEIMLYKNKIEERTQDFKNLYSDIIDKYMMENQIKC